MAVEHYFSEKPGAKQDEKEIEYTINSIIFRFKTSSSVFSKDKIDKGTELLIRESRISEDARILDIGCGYGAVGVILAKLFPQAKVTMSDINERALALAKKNIKLNNSKAEIIKSSLYENLGKFGIILSNPPQSAGKAICFAIIEGAKEHLEAGGTLQIVARPNVGGRTLAGKMDEVFGNVEIIGRKSGYAIYLSELIL